MNSSYNYGNLKGLFSDYECGRKEYDYYASETIQNYAHEQTDKLANNIESQVCTDVMINRIID